MGWEIIEEANGRHFIGRDVRPGDDWNGIRVMFPVVFSDGKAGLAERYWLSQILLKINECDEIARDESL